MEFKAVAAHLIRRFLCSLEERERLKWEGGYEIDGTQKDGGEME